MGKLILMSFIARPCSIRAGLHPADTEALLSALGGLKAAGNSLFVVEHDLDVVRRADWLVDVGPGAGEQGGEILYSGPPEGLRDVQNSKTAEYLFRTAPQEARQPRTPSSLAAWGTSATGWMWRATKRSA